MATEKTVTLPALKEGLAYIPLPVIDDSLMYRSIPRVVTVDQGEGTGSWTIPVETLTDYMFHNTFVYGGKQLGNDGAAGTGKDTVALKAAGRLDRHTRVEDGTYRFGAGGGGKSRSLYDKEMEKYFVSLVRERVPATKGKKGLAKTWYDDHGGEPEKVFRTMVDLACATVPGSVPQDIYDKNYPGHEAKVKASVAIMEKAAKALVITVAKGDPMNLAA